ncbi:MAG: winged helix-turn-helix domain-containing protein [Acidimicrobiia bacterium]
MTDHIAPDYPLEETLEFETSEQFRALFEDTRLRIVDLLLERAATVTELAETLGKPKGTVGHHVAVLERAGLVHVVRTKKVRAIEAKYYGRTARTYLLTPKIDVDIDVSPDYFLSSAAIEYAKAAQVALSDEIDPAMISTLRYARIPVDRAREWALKLGELAQEFASEPRGGETTFGLLLAMYPTDRPHLPDRDEKGDR